jgi:hypothetical protein
MLQPYEGEAAPEAEPMVEAAEPEVKEYDAAECAKIKEFEKLIEIPTWCQDVFTWMDEDAKYLAEDCIYASQDDEHSTSTNYILRNQFVLISQIYARNPTPRIQPSEIMGDQPPGLAEFAKTLEIVAKRLGDEAGFKQKLAGALQDVQTYGIAWLKLSTQEDLTKDPLGASRQNDQLDNIAQLKVLTSQYSNGDFDEEDSRYKDLLDLTDTIKTYMAGSIREDLARNPPQPVSQIDEMGQETLVPDPNDPRMAQMASLQDPQASVEPGMLPEVPIFMGVNIDEVQPQDIRFDWSITRPEDFYNAGWVAHRVYMTADAINQRWDIDDTEWADIDASVKNATKRDKSSHEDPSNRTSNDQEQINGLYAVWELWDKATGRRYVWTQGMERFFVNEVVKVSWHKFFPFFPVVFNRVTGRFLPMSDVRLQRPLQEEINTKRTQERESNAAAQPRYIVAAGVLNDKEKEKIENARAYAVIELERADEVMKYWSALPVQTPDPLLYDISKAVREIEISAGITQNAAGGVGGAEFATEAAIANQQASVSADRRKDIIEDLIHDVYECIVELALQLFPEENIKAIAGPMAVWPLVDRDHLWRQLHVVIEPGMSGKPDEAKVLEKWLNFSDVMNKIGLVVNPMEVGRKIIEELNLGIDFKRFIIDPALIAQANAPGAAGAPGDSGPNKDDNGKTIPAGKGPGAPPMGERSGTSAVPGPGNVTNAPTGNPQ